MTASSPHEAPGSDDDGVLVALKDLVAFPTITSDSNLDLIDHVHGRLVGVADEVFVVHDESGEFANLCATFGGRKDAGGVMLSGHTDVVPAEPAEWATPPFVATRRGDRIYGRGTADMKGFLACLLRAAPLFAAADLEVPVHLAFTFGEEIGCQGAPVLLEAFGRRGIDPEVAIVGEPTSMNVVHAHKGCYEYTTTIRGADAHGSTPARGVSALEYGLRYVDRLLMLRGELAARADEGVFDPPGSTINVGRFEAGSARNVVAGSCEIQWEMRPVTADDAAYVLGRLSTFERELDAELRSVVGSAGLQRTTVGAVGGLEPAADSPALELIDAVLPEAELEVASYSTEAGVFQAAGISSIVCGPGAIEVAHRPDEYVTVDQLGRSMEMLAALSVELSVGDPT
ncbi:MAG: acetylornithine deacetylase [Nitriliruptorales bacterium]|nr:acetylornithine deacetylase [Nitriliruptorales bacterium]